LQASFASQAAVADTEEARRQLASTARGALGLMGVVWLGIVGWWLARHDAMRAAYQLSHPLSLWLVLFACLAALLAPVPLGVLQGRQDFLWFGWATLLNGVGRFVVLYAVVKVLGGGTMGALAGVLAGSLAVLALVLWRTRDTWLGAGGGFAWRPWLRRLVPVTVGLGALTFVMQADAIVVREHLRPQLTAAEADGYSAVRTIGLAMVFLVAALTSVMYPKVARSFQRSEKTDALKLTVWLTAGIGVGGALVATALPELPLRLLSPPALWGSKVLVPAFCWALVPVALANVLIWSLLARECYRSVPWLAAVAVAYWLALERFHGSLQTVITVMGLFGMVLLAVCAVFLRVGGGRREA
jgi:O-antigen/teichoic acid export membrane protein